MGRSTFHHSCKASDKNISYSPQTSDKSFIQKTAPRIAPRISEGGVFEANQPINNQKYFNFRPKNIDKLIESPLQKRPKEIK